VPLKAQSLLSECEVALVHNLGNDVDTIGQLKVDEIGFAVLYLINGGFFLSARLDIGELVVVIDRGN
jgi:hypothetical protein